jgi:hypothetical protein
MDLKKYTERILFCLLPLFSLPSMAAGNAYVKFNDRIEMDFEYQTASGELAQNPEYLVRIVDKNREGIDLILNQDRQGGNELLIVSSKILSKKLLKTGGTSSRWHLCFDLTADRLTVNVEDTAYIETGLGLQANTYLYIRMNDERMSRLKTFPDWRPHPVDKSSKALYWIIIIIVMDLGWFLWIFYHKRTGASTGDKEAYVIKETWPAGGEQQQSAIFLFGEFRILNKAGDDISKKFTPLLKELMLITLLYSCKNAQGVSTATWRDIFWLNKSIQTANNNKAVNIGKLKTLLNEVGNYEIVSNSAYLKIVLGNDIFCDYVICRNLLNGQTLSKQQIVQIIDLTKRGALLTDCNYTWMDTFKAEIADAMLDALLGFSKMIDRRQENRLIIHLADAVFRLDPLNEEALSLKCSALIDAGKHSLAKTDYRRFCKEYKELFSTPYPYTFPEVLASAVKSSSHI